MSLSTLKDGTLEETSFKDGERFAIPRVPTTPDEESVTRLQEEVRRGLPIVELPSLIVEVDRWSKFSRMVVHPNDGRCLRGERLMHFYAAILA